MHIIVQAFTARDLGNPIRIGSLFREVKERGENNKWLGPGLRGSGRVGAVRAEKTKLDDVIQRASEPGIYVRCSLHELIII